MKLNEFDSALRQAQFKHSSSVRLLKTDLLRMPYQFIGVLTFNKKGEYGKSELGFATAWQISKNTLLTCAHSIFDKQLYEQYTQIRYYPYAYDKLQYFVKVVGVRFNKQQYLSTDKTTSRMADYAVLLLDSSNTVIKNKTKYLKLLANYSIIDNQVELAGYPSDKIMFDTNGAIYAYQITSTGKAIKMDFQIPHIANSDFGSSGSPLMITYQNQTVVIGLHYATDQTLQQNKGLFFNEQIIQNVNKWQHQLTKGSEQLNASVFKQVKDQFVEDQLYIKMTNQEWNDDLINSRHYKFQQHFTRASYLKQNNYRQIVTKSPLPSVGKFVCHLRIYSKVGQFIFGVITELRVKQQMSGREIKGNFQSIGYLNFNKSQNDKVILLESTASDRVLKKEVPFIKSNSIIKLYFDMDKKQIHWFNENYIATTVLPPQFYSKQLYIFAVARYEGDIFQLM